MSAAECELPCVPAATLQSCTGLGFNLDGVLFIVDTLNSKVFKVLYNNRTLSLVAGTGVPGYSGDGTRCSCVPLCCCRMLMPPPPLRYSCARHVNSLGGPAVLANLNQPTDIAISDSDRIFIADQNNHRIRVIDRGIITTFAGTGVEGYLDGTGGDWGLLSGAECVRG